VSDCDHGHPWVWAEEPDRAACFDCDAEGIIVPVTGSFVVVDGVVRRAAEEFGHGGRLWTIEPEGDDEGERRPLARACAFSPDSGREGDRNMKSHDRQADCPTWGPVPLPGGKLVSYECRCPRPEPLRATLLVEHLKSYTTEKRNGVQPTGDRGRPCYNCSAMGVAGDCACRGRCDGPWFTRAADLARRLLRTLHRRG